MSLRFSLAGGETLGRRDDQEDFHLLRWPGSGGGRDPGQGVAWADVVVSDGMGGHSAGEVASAQASVAFFKTLPAEPVAFEKLAGNMFDALDVANGAITDWISNYPSAQGMGCTLLGARLDCQGLTWISVGDSPLYLIRDGTVRQLNADHSFASVLRDRVAAGEIDISEVAVHPQRNQLMSALVGGELDLIDLAPSPFALYPGDILLFTTDGIITLNDERILEVATAALRHGDGESQGTISSPKMTRAERIVVALLQAVAQVGNDYQDNTTVVAVECHGEDMQAV